MSRFLLVPLMAVAVWSAVLGRTAWAGGGPENVFVVVNSRSWASMAVANHFCRLRSIPAGNILYLPWQDSVVETDLETFRDRIFLPTVATINARRLARQIDYIVYSSDFPYVVQVESEFSGAPWDPTGSITGMTYLGRWITASSSEHKNLLVNSYARRVRRDGQLMAPTHGFRANYMWGPKGEIVKERGRKYFLSTMLAYTSGRGNSVSEAIRYLSRSAQADGSHPKGTFYFVKNDNVRSTTRDRSFPATVAELEKLHAKAKIVIGKFKRVPQRRDDVLGVTSGAVNFDWKASGSTILPGAICDNLTSYGGILKSDAGRWVLNQTPLTDFLRHGAAGASGTVVEPTANQHKFPHAMMHVHYARGCSLAEAFYQSVNGPYQLLIVGDPLCRPWATIPTVFVEGVKPGETVKGTLTLKPSARTVAGTKIRQFQLFLDGTLIAQRDPGQNFQLDTEPLADGHHELRLVAIDDSPIESQGRLILPVVFNNRGRTIQCQTQPPEAIRWDETLSLTVDAPGSTKIHVYHNRRLIADLDGERGRLKIDPRTLGQGPVSLVVVGVGDSSSGDYVFAPPIDLLVQAPIPLSARRPPRGTALADGLQITLADGRVVVVQQTAPADRWLADAGVRPNETFRLSGYFNVSQEDVYQFQTAFDGRLGIRVDGRLLLNRTGGRYEHHYLPVSLDSGLHRLDIEGQTTGKSRLFLAFGGQGTPAVGGDRFKHSP